ncbi:MAG: hypothetical protein JXR83_01195 [Deltaproteobacteria bacterium]|nr:hypothetical protein [Deltaproteobacteria bacterium]
MTVSGIRRLKTAILADNKITRPEVDQIIKKAKDWFFVTAGEKEELKQLLAEHGDKFEPEARTKLAKFLKIALPEPTPPTPAPAPVTPTPTPAPVRPTPAPDPVPPGPIATGASAVTDIGKIAEAFGAEYARREGELGNKPAAAFALFAEYGGRLKALKNEQPGMDPKIVDQAIEDLLSAGRKTSAKGYDKVDSDKDTISDLGEAARGSDPNKFDGRVMAADHKVWTTTYWPMAGSGDMDQPGSPTSHLWAKEGPLAKLDKLLTARGMADRAKALEFERKPALSWLIGDHSNKGEFIPRSSISENDAEMTTGVDFDGDGKLTAGVRVDFLDARGDFAPAYSRSAFKPKLQDGDKTIDLTRKEVRAADGSIEKFEFFRPDGTKLTPDEAGKVYYTHGSGDGKVGGTMSVGWWGSCDKVALAGILFKDPQKDVTLDGVTFTAQDIRGLLTVLADSQAVGHDFVGNRYDEEADHLSLKNGQSFQGKIETNIDFRASGHRRYGDMLTLDKIDQDVTIRLPNGESKTFKADEISSLSREDVGDVSPMDFHQTMVKWLGEDKRPAAMDRDSGSHVWNYNFWKADLKEGTKLEGTSRPTESGYNGPASDGEIMRYSMDVYFGETGYPVNYGYWLEYDKEGKIINGGWLSENPDFLWRPGGFNNWAGRNDRNPFVDPALVKEIYLQSIDNG